MADPANGREQGAHHWDLARGRNHKGHILEEDRARIVGVE